MFTSMRFRRYIGSLWAVIILLASAACSATLPILPDTPAPSLASLTPASPRPSRTPLPTRRPTRTATPRPTPAPTPSAYTFPAWLADPESVVLVTMRDVSEHYLLAFLNVSTGERVDLPITNILGYFWTPDGHSFGLLSRDEHTIHLIDLSSGALAYHAVDERVTRFLAFDSLHGLPLPLVASASLPEEQSFVLLHRNLVGVSAYPVELSADRRHVAWYDNRRGCVFVEELATGTLMQVTDSSDGVFDRRFYWSPADQRLAVLQGVSDTLPFSWNADRVTVYDVTSSTVAASYQGAFEYLEWSPDGSRLLYTDRAGEYDHRNAPCLLDLASGERSCLQPLADISPGNPLYTTLYGWTPDGQSITYAHCGSGSPQQGGFCHFDLQDGTVFCPTEGLPEMQDRAVRGYSLSPDGHYVVLLTDEMCPTDDTGPQGTFVIGLDGTGYIPLWQPQPRGSWNIPPPFYTALWRPVPEP